MKTTFKLIGLMLSAGIITLAACKKNNDKEDESNGKNCFTCQNCEGQYGHLMNIEYCVDGFDNRKDWLDAKKQHENNNNCDCEFN